MTSAEQLGTPGKSDSLEKMVQKLACLSLEPIRYGQNEKVLVAEPTTRIRIGPSMWRRFLCGLGCSACCQFRITIDFIPEEAPFERYKKWADYLEIPTLIDQVIEQLREVQANPLSAPRGLIVYDKTWLT